MMNFRVWTKRLLSICIGGLLTVTTIAATHSNHNGSLTVEVSPKGAGYVYMQQTSGAYTGNDWKDNQMKEEWSCSEDDKKDSRTYYATAKEKAGNGYWFAGWGTSSASVSATDNPYSITHSIDGNTSATYYAIFNPVQITGIEEGNPVLLYPASLTTVSTGTITFTQQGGNEKEDFVAPSFGNVGGNQWKITSWNFNASTGKVTVGYSYVANRSTYKNALGNRVDVAELQLSSKARLSAACRIEAHFPLEISNGTAEHLSLLLPNATASGVATFPVNRADTKTDFKTPVFVSTGGAASSAWTITSWDYADNLVTVHYMFRGDGVNRNNSATLTLSSSDDSVSNSCTISATIPPSQVLLPTTAENLNPVLPNTTYKGTAVFEVQYAGNYTVAFGEQQGVGTWNVLSSTYRITDAATGKGNVTVEYSYTTAADYTARTNSNTLTLTLDGGAVSSSCAITANFPSLAMSVQSNDVLVMTLPERTQAGKVVFAVTYANGAADFVLPTATDSRWSIIDMQYASLSPSSGTLTVNYTFDNGGEKDDWTTDLTLQTASGATCVATLRAIAEQESDKDAAVTTPAGETTKYEKWADALLAANSEDGCTLRLLRNVELGTLAANQEIKRNMTLDLNGKTLSATLTSTYCRLLYLNTEGITLTVTDSRSGGAIVAIGDYANIMYAVQVNKGYLVLDKGHLEVKNSTTGNNDVRYAVAVYQAANTVFTMNGGELVATKPTSRNAYGVYAEAGSTTNINGGVITATAGSFAYGVRSYGNVTMTAGTINAITTATSYAYGIYMGASANADAAKCNYGTLNMTGGFVNALTAEGAACGVYLHATFSGLTDNAPDGTYTNKASAVGVLKNAVITAHSHTIASGITSYGVWCVGSYNSKDGQNVSTLLENCTIEALITDVSASNNTTSSAYGIYVAASVSDVLGAKLEGNVALTNCNVTAKSEGYRPKGTYNGVTYANGTHGNAYGLYVASASNVIKNAASPIEHVGEMYATAAKAVVNGGTYTAVANKNTANAVCSAVRAVTYDGQTAYPELYLNGGTYYAETLTGTTAYALNSGGNTVVDGGEFTALAGTTTAAGFYVNAGKLTATGSVVSATGKTGTAYGVYLMRGFNDVSAKGYDAEAVLNNLDVTVSTTEGNTANGIYVYAGETKTYTDATFKTWAASNSIKIIDGNGNIVGSTDAQKAVNTKLYEVYNRCYQRGEFVNIPKSVTVNGGTYSATAEGTTAYGINMPNTGVSATGQKQASVPLTATNAKFTAKTNSGATAYGIQTGGPTVIDNCDITAEAATTTARGIFLQDGKAKVSDCTITVSGTTTVCGIYANASVLNGHTLYVDLTAENNIVTAKTTTGGSAYGVYLHAVQSTPTSGIFAGHEYAAAANAVITGGKFTATAKTSTAYGIYAVAPVVTTNGNAYAASELTVSNATVIAKAESENTVYAIQGSGPTTVTGCDISATAPNGATVRGVFLQNGEATVANSVIVAEGCKNDVFGIYADAVVNGTNGYATFVDLTSDNNTVTATSLHGSNAYGLYLKTASTLIEKGTYIGTESAAASSAVIKAGSYTADANSAAYGIISSTRAVSACGGAEAWSELIVNGATVSATTDSLNTAYALQSGGKAIVDGGRFAARTAGTNAYGFYVTAGNLVATGTTITATAGKGDAEGIYLTTGIADICMAPQNTSAELNNLNVTVRTLTGNSAYGIRIIDNGTSKNQTDTSFETWCKNTKKIMDADGNITNQALYDIYNAGYKRGEFVEAVHNVIVNGGTYDAVSNGTTAYGVKTMNAPVVSATGKTSAATELTMRNATISATTETGATAYGVYTSGPTTIDNCDISATSATTGAQGIYVKDGKTKVSHSNVAATANGYNTGNGNTDVYGIYAHAEIDNNGWHNVADLQLDTTQVKANAIGNQVYALYLFATKKSVTSDTYGRKGDHAVAASAVINGGAYTAKAMGNTIISTDGKNTVLGPKSAYAIQTTANQVQGAVSAAPLCAVNGGKFWGEASLNTFADISPNALVGKLLINDGYFRNSTNVTPYIREGYSLFDLPATTKEYKEGYRYFIAPASASGTYVCEVVGQQQKYKTLEEALQFVNLNPNTAYTIRMLANYTLPAGDYVLPAKATLLIPYKENQTAIGTTAKRTDNNNSNAVPTAYVTLTLASGVNLSVQGIIEASAEQYNAGNPYGRVAATYGHLLLKENTAVTLESGSKLIAWGYVTGKGTIEAKDGATLYEDFSIADWKGGGVTSKMQGNKQKVFPITHYFYQNIEATVVYRPGAVAIGSSSVQTSVATADVDNVYLVGTSDNGNVLFMMDKANASQDTYLKKEYDFVKDITYWTMNNGVTLNSIKISATGVNLESIKYVLPITSNFHITLDYGTVSIMQDTYFMPNTVLTIKKEATLSIPSGHTLYIVDSDQWNALCYGGATTVGGLLPVYSPSWENPKKRGLWSNNTIDCTKMSDAEIFVHGTIEVAGKFYTTEGGANIHSTNEDAGKVIFRKTEPASTTDKLYLCNTDCGKSGMFSYYWNYETYTLTSAKLKNGNDTYTQTASTNEGESFIYVNDQWIKTVDNGCMSTVTDGAGEHLYIHAGDMVEVLENGDHAYKDKATGTRYFINTNAAKGQADCVWWEVEPKDGGYYMANQEKYDNYGTYYNYDSASDFWKPKTVTVTWNNWDGTMLAAYSDVSYNTSPKYLGATPTRQNTAIAKYAWTGWTDAEGKFYEKNITLPVALADMTYTAWFTENKYQYSVTFMNPDGSLIESGLWNEGDMPACSVTPQKAPTTEKIFTFIGWQPELTSVSGPAEYTAQYTADTRCYTVTFANYDGTVLYTEDFAHGTVPVYRGTTPVRESNAAYSYTFSGWSPTIKAIDGNDENIIYTAQFTAKEREYGDMLDVVDWTADGIVLNMNGYTSPSAKAGWIVTADGIDYSKTDRLPNRTLELSLQQDYAADDEVLILAKGTDGVVESRRRYKVPHVFDADAVLGAVAADNSSVIFVRAGKLTVTGDATVAAVYVAPGAELCINAGVTLAAGKLVLRTEAFLSAVFTNNGTLLCDNVCYSRIVSDKMQAYPFALPFASDLTKTTYSNGKAATLGVHYGLLTYDAQQRADYGLTMEQGPNWVGLPKDETELKACKGYQLLSTSGFYSEYCFPVAYHPTTGDKNVPLLAYKGTTDKTGVSDWGWNTICSPYTQMYEYEAETVSPESVVKISVLNPEDNRTWSQTPATKIAPASLFFYQTEAAGTLSFGADLFAFQQAASRSIVARRAEHNYSSQPTQWIRIFCDTEDGKSDETSIYLHPDKFTIGYQAGYDVVKLSEQGALPFMWSSVPYGNMAFAALPDTVAEQGIPLTVFAPQTEEINLSLIDNQWLSRLEHVYLLDREQQTLTDLLQNDYSYHAIAGTAAGRFVVYPIFRTPGMTDDLTMTDAAASFTAYGVEKNILVSHLPQNVQLACYDLMGRLVYTAFATTDALSIAVPAAGIYFVQVMDEVQKVIVR